MGITDVLKVQQCPHVTVRTFAWIENLPGKPPSFVYDGFPEGGLVVLSKNEIVVVCKRCRGNYLLVQPRAEEGSLDYARLSDPRRSV